MKTLPALLLLALPVIANPPDLYLPETDWLVDATPFKARVERAADGGTIALDNGLIRRVLRITNGCATVAFDNRMSGEGLLRATQPEALLTLEGKAVAIGGLKGQPNRAYLTPEWLAAMQADPAAYRLVGLETGITQERFAWKRVRHHAPGAVWPPPGVSLRLDFEPPVERLAESLDTTLGRTLLWEDDFSSIRADWKETRSAAGERVSFNNEGKAGEIFAPPGVHCFADRALPEQAGLVELTLTLGTDTSSSWGPGLGLVFANGHVAKVNARPGDRGSHGHFELRDGRGEQLRSVPALAAADGGLDLAKPLTLRVRIFADRLVWEVAGDDGKVSHPLFETPRAASWGRPVAVRAGKMNPSGGAGDDGKAPVAEWARLKLQRARVFGPQDASVLTAAAASRPAPLRVSVHYELYDGLPVLSKWITVHNRGAKPVTVDRFTAEVLSVVEHSNDVESPAGVALPPPSPLHVETDQAFSGFTQGHANRHAVRWTTEPEFTSQVNYALKTPCRLEVSPFRGPAQVVAPGGTFTSFRVFELVQDATDRERRGLALRRMYRAMAPWVTENPLMFHMLSSNPQQIRAGIDQCVATGFEMLIMSFGSGFNAESGDPAYYAKWREVADYARSKGVDLGGYSLLASRRVGGGNDVVSAPGEHPAFGASPALTSTWGTNYFAKVRALYEASGLSILEHDGSYPGDWDVTPRPPLQRGLEDSQWAQWTIIRDFYQWCRGRGIYLNVPDFYYLAGSSKCGMGYREVNWSLPRAQQLIHTRQNIFDGTWEKTPSMGWMFVPLSQYHGGGAAATIEPLDTHLDHYESMMVANLASGVQACYRGPRLFDTDRTRERVKGVVDWFKKHRDILESDVIHLRRADGRDWDGLLHVNPALEERGMMTVFNPTTADLEREILVPLYYSGLRGRCRVSINDGEARTMDLDGKARLRLRVSIPAGRWTSVVFRAAGE